MPKLFEKLVGRRQEIADAAARVAVQEAITVEDITDRALRLAQWQPQLARSINHFGRVLRTSKTEADSVVLGIDTDGARIVAAPRYIGEQLHGFDFKAVAGDGDVTDLESELFALGGGASEYSSTTLIIKDGAVRWENRHGVAREPSLAALEEAEASYKDARDVLNGIIESAIDPILNPGMAERLTASLAGQ